MLSFIRKNRLSKAFIQMSGAGVFVQFFALCITPVLSRLYTPTDFGLFGTLCSIASLFSIIAAFRYEYAFFIEKKNMRYFFLISICFITLTTLSASVILPYFFDYSFVLLFFSLSSISLYNVVIQFSVAQSMYKKLSVSRVIQGSVQYLLALALGLLVLPKGLIYSFIIGQLAAALFLYLQLKIDFRNISIKKLTAIFKKNIVYSTNSTFTSALQWSTPLAPMLIGGFVFTPKVLGVYFLIIQGINGITSVPRRSLINICTSELNTPERFRDRLLPFLKKVLCHRISVLIIALVLVTLITLHIWGEDIIAFILGSEWKEGGKYITTLVLFSCLDLFFYPFVHLLNLWRKYSSVIVIEISRFLFIYCLIPGLAYYFKLDFSLYILGHFLFMFLFNLITFLCLIKVSKC